VIERVIENWLTSVNERQYQLPFCQLLAAAGEEVVYVSSHGPFEQGKDIITLTDVGPRAYQLKTGDLSLTEWRKIKGEIEELVEYTIQHPAVRTKKRHQPILVTNGELNDTVVHAIQALNREWKRRRFPTLQVISRGTLLKMFLSLHGTFLPREPKDFQAFLTLLLAVGNEPLDKPRFAQFIESVLPLEHNPTKHNLQRAIASMLLLANYVLRAAQERKNHWAQFEAWTMVGTYILGVATKYSLASTYWVASFNLCKLGIEQAVKELLQECNTEQYFVEGNPTTDGHFFHERGTIIAGMACAYALAHNIDGTSIDNVDVITRMTERAAKRVGLWGESAIPYLLCIALRLGQTEATRAEDLVLLALKSMVTTNAGNLGRGVPDPYHGPEECVRIALGFDEDNMERFHGQLYTAEALIDYLARRLRRQSLASLWYEITEISFAQATPKAAWDWFRWQSDNVELVERLPARPQRWQALLIAASERSTVDVPTLLRQHAWFLPYYLLVYPHRLQSNILKVLEDAL
jgi:hypothetical protein